MVHCYHWLHKAPFILSKYLFLFIPTCLPTLPPQISNHSNVFHVCLAKKYYPCKLCTVFREPAFFDINATVYYSSPTGSWGNWVQDLHGYQWGFPSGSVVKSSPANAGDGGSILGLGRSPGEGNGNLPQCFCLENSMAKRAWQAAIHRVTKSHKVCSQLSN